MPDLETAVRSAIGLLCRRYRVVSIPAADDEAVASILGAAGKPDGMITTDGPEAAAALAGLKERAEGMEALAREMHDGFKRGANGYSQRVGTDTFEGWRERLGEKE